MKWLRQHPILEEEQKEFENCQFGMPLEYRASLAVDEAPDLDEDDDKTMASEG